jgi:hypothetical protein
MEDDRAARLAALGEVVRSAVVAGAPRRTVAATAAAVAFALFGAAAHAPPAADGQAPGPQQQRKVRRRPRRRVANPLVPASSAYASDEAVGAVLQCPPASGHQSTVASSDATAIFARDPGVDICRRDERLDEERRIWKEDVAKHNAEIDRKLAVLTHRGLNQHRALASTSIGEQSVDSAAQ